MEHPDELKLGAFHDGELSPADLAAVSAHVVDCDPCGRYLAALAELSAWMTSAAAGSAGLSPIGRARLRRRLEGVTDQGLVRFGWRLSGAAAAVLVTAAGWLAWSAARPAATATASSSSSVPAVVPPWVTVNAVGGADPVAVATATPAAAWYGVDVDGNGGM